MGVCAHHVSAGTKAHCVLFAWCSDDLFDSSGKPKLITTVSKLNFVDLAGSERVKSKNAAAGGIPLPASPSSHKAQHKMKKQVEEGINVNKYVSALLSASSAQVR